MNKNVFLIKWLNKRVDWRRLSTRPNVGSVSASITGHYVSINSFKHPFPNTVLLSLSFSLSFYD